MVAALWSTGDRLRQWNKYNTVVYSRDTNIGLITRGNIGVYLPLSKENSSLKWITPALRIAESFPAW